MSLEVGRLWFWRVKPKKKVKPETLLSALQGPGEAAELEDLPVADILKGLKKQYPSFKLNQNVRAGEVDIQEEEMAFEVCWSNRHFHFVFFGNAEKHMDRVIDLMTRFSLPCYVPDENKAYTLKRPPRFSPSPEEDEYFSEIEKRADEEMAKIRASTSVPNEQVRRWHEFLRAEGVKSLGEQAVRRIQERKKKSS